MSHIVMNNPSSSSDESDIEKQCMSVSKNNLGPKMVLNPKAYSPDSGELALFTESGSEKESGASRDSDSSASISCYPLPRKRKTPEKNKSKGSDCESSPKVLVRDYELFLQPDSCSKLAKNAKFWKCRECYKSQDADQYSCRFFSFRKLTLSKNNVYYPKGFASPEDAIYEDKKLWLPDFSPSNHSDQGHVDFHLARFILSQVGDQFCNLITQEQEAIKLHMGQDDSIAWKKPMQGVREMCDVCKTTLFNFHWACGRCGFVVCIDCYKVRKNGVKKEWMVRGVDHDEWKWVNCTTRQPHEQDVLMLCQTIAADCLSELGQLVHEIKDLYGIPRTCKCDVSSKSKSLPNIDLARVKELMRHDPINAITSHLEGGPRIVNRSVEMEDHILKEAGKQILPDMGIFISKQEESSSDSEDESVNQSGLRDLLVPQNNTNHSNGDDLYSGNHITSLNPKVPKFSFESSDESVQQYSELPPSKQIKASSNSTLLDDIISSIQETSHENVKPMQHFVRRNQGLVASSQNQPHPRVMTKFQSEELYPDVPHSWLCDGWLLRLIDPSHRGNYRIFQDQWKRGQPVIVGNMTSLLNMELWHPRSFCRDFGEERNDLINCATGHLVPNRPMKEFWEGFEHYSKRLKDDRGNPMLLKLKDWPPGEDFAELLPKRFDDLMQALPLAEYTRRNGRLNLASCLPDFFVRPDLGPKLYNAYGSALYPTKGTTNLHLDISDAVNFMVYVGIPCDTDYTQHINEAYNAIDEAGCDEMTRKRIRTKEEMPGALWHIYHACDADKIRDLLNKVAIERGTRLEPHHDPIHDQSWYLDAELRERLYKEYNVQGYAIVQCLGDAVFIPAGAPHQVRNLHNCVKVAEDFVSPENVSQCFSLTQEFRDLSDTHTNHEDKLQIKNIIYHTIRSAVSSLVRDFIL